MYPTERNIITTENNNIIIRLNSGMSVLLPALLTNWLSKRKDVLDTGLLVLLIIEVDKFNDVLELFTTDSRIAGLLLVEIIEELGEGDVGTVTAKIVLDATAKVVAKRWREELI
jgi:hypothetical protein